MCGSALRGVHGQTLGKLVRPTPKKRLAKLLRSVRPKKPTLDSITVLVGLRRMVERALDTDMAKYNRVK